MSAQNMQSRAQRVTVPSTDLYETEKAMVLLADLPGVADKDVSVTLEKDVLTLEGKLEGKSTAPREGYTLAYGEYEAASFRRVFTVSADVDRNKIEATLRDGVLKVVLSKTEPAKARRIAVKAG